MLWNVKKCYICDIQKPINTQNMTQLATFKEYATEDIKEIVQTGAMILTNTAFLCTINFAFDGKNFTATKTDGTELLKTNRQALMRDFLVNCYTA